MSFKWRFFAIFPQMYVKFTTQPNIQNGFIKKHATSLSIFSGFVNLPVPQKRLPVSRLYVEITIWKTLHASIYSPEG